MSRASLWQEFESGDGALLKLLRFVIIAGGISFLVFSGILELTWPQQIILDALIVPLSGWIEARAHTWSR